MNPYDLEEMSAAVRKRLRTTINAADQSDSHADDLALSELMAAADEITRLRAEVERLKADLDATNAALREFGHHDGRCAITDLDPDGNHLECDCGLSVALGDQVPGQGGGE